MFSFDVSWNKKHPEADRNAKHSPHTEALAVSATSPKLYYTNPQTD